MLNAIKTWPAMLVVLLLANTVYADSVCVQAKLEHDEIAVKTPSADFSDNGDGTVTHHTTGLIWQRCSLGQTWDGAGCNGSATSFLSSEARQQASTNHFAGASDWRLPNIDELASLIELRCFVPSINSQIFPDTAPDSYWSSSFYEEDNYYTWIVSFGSGSVYYMGGSMDGKIRLVRGGLQHQRGLAVWL